MPSDRYFVDQHLEKGDTVSLQDKELHHFRHVMKVDLGSHVKLINGRGQLAIAAVSLIEKQQALLEVQDLQEQEPSPFDIVLAQAVPRANRLDSILEKSTELGVTRILLFPGERSENQSFYGKRQDRCRSVLVAAMKQCGRLFLPKLEEMPPLCEWEKLGLSAFYGSVEEKAPLFGKLWKTEELSKEVVFFVGPEKGFSPKEISYLEMCGAKGVKLHDNILRTDTAPIVALSLMQHWLMERRDS